MANAPAQTTVKASSQGGQGSSSLDLGTLRFSGGVGLSMGNFYLGEGLILENDTVLSSRNAMYLALRPFAKVDSDLGFATLEVSGRAGNSETLNAKVFRTGGTVGRAVGPVDLAVLGCLDVARLDFQDVEYIKRSLGYSYGLRAGYCITDEVCINGQAELGILGSHSTRGFNMGALYQF
jgi:hypothetical protein